MKRTLLSRLRSNGIFYIVGAAILLILVPLYQQLVLTALGYNLALSAVATGHLASFMAWINTHTLEFISYRALLVIAFACLATLPFSLYRIIVAQEIMAQVENETEQDEQEERAEESDVED